MSLYIKIISLDNLFAAWDEFYKDKKQKPDVARYAYKLEQNLFELHRDLAANSYRHGGYKAFIIQDPKQRLINKAIVRDRILHHAIVRVISPIFEPKFITHSYSCQIGKGTHRGVLALEKMLRKESLNNKRECWALKCDVAKFFASVDHGILLNILGSRIRCPETFKLLTGIVKSFEPCKSGKGLPIGNLTSQLFANVYMNKFDQFIKHELRVKRYVRYTDDFVLVNKDREYLLSLIPLVQDFLSKWLELTLHPNKVEIRKFTTGIDFLGYVILPHYRKVRTKTVKRILQRVNAENIASYMGVFTHADSYELRKKVAEKIWYG